MSVVGPRPIVEEELAAYGDAAGELLSVKPGITGWWQVQARNDATYGDGSRQELELWTTGRSLKRESLCAIRSFPIPSTRNIGRAGSSPIFQRSIRSSSAESTAPGGCSTRTCARR